MNFYEEDLVTLRNRYGWGWSEVVRNWVRQMLKKDVSNDKR